MSNNSDKNIGEALSRILAAANNWEKLCASMDEAPHDEGVYERICRSGLLERCEQAETWLAEAEKRITEKNQALVIAENKRQSLQEALDQGTRRLAEIVRTMMGLPDGAAIDLIAAASTARSYGKMVRLWLNLKEVLGMINSPDDAITGAVADLVTLHQRLLMHNPQSPPLVLDTKQALLRLAQLGDIADRLDCWRDWASSASELRRRAPDAEYQEAITALLELCKHGPASSSASTNGDRSKPLSYQRSGGLFYKYSVGRTEAGKHDPRGTEYFVLAFKPGVLDGPEIEALCTYVSVVELKHPVLAQDLRSRYLRHRTIPPNCEARIDNDEGAKRWVVSFKSAHGFATSGMFGPWTNYLKTNQELMAVARSEAWAAWDKGLILRPVNTPAPTPVDTACDPSRTSP